jgi:hypothetical protein
MRRVVGWLLLAACAAACSTREIVVKPEEVPGLNDPQWKVGSEPGPRPR